MCPCCWQCRSSMFNLSTCVVSWLVKCINLTGSLNTFENMYSHTHFHGLKIQILWEWELQLKHKLRVWTRGMYLKCFIHVTHIHLILLSIVYKFINSQHILTKICLMNRFYVYCLWSFYNRVYSSWSFVMCTWTYHLLILS